MNDCTWNNYIPRRQFQREMTRVETGEWTLNGCAIGELAARAGKPGVSDDAHSGCPWDYPTSDEHLVYEHSFALPEAFLNENVRTILHFDAVDQVCEVFLNDRLIGSHEGGYLPFSFDISEAAYPADNRLRVEVTDTLSPVYPYGKQCRDPHGMWYTPTSGIWQPVWIEAVPRHHGIRSIRITPDLTGIALAVDTDAPDLRVVVSDPNAEEILTLSTKEKTVRLEIPDPRRWTPAHPCLYNLTIETDTDRIVSYFALRTVSVRTIGGIPRLCLNNKPVYLHAVLDQGYFDRGGYLPHSPDAYARQNDQVKALGFNTIRKHIKIEPDVFYWECDRRGILVIQDIVNSGVYDFWRDTVVPTVFSKRRKDTGRPLSDKQRHDGNIVGKIRRGKAEAQALTADEESYRRTFFEQAMHETIDHLYNHPCLIGYTLFNEGWGQFDSDRLYEAAKQHDPTRFYDSTSGWFAQDRSDVRSEHVYFRNKKLTAKDRGKAGSDGKFLFLSECGGFTRDVPGHSGTTAGKKTYGYGKTATEEDLTDKIEVMYNKMVIPSIHKGLCGSVYTQVTDVEGEINGLYTSDRQVCKVNADRMRAVARRVYKAFAQAVRGGRAGNRK